VACEQTHQVAGWCEAHYVDLMPHNPFGPICTAACIHVGAAVPNFCAMECFQVPPTRVFARHLCFALFRATSRPGWYRSFTVPTCRSFVLQDRVIDSKIFPQHHTREGGASTDGSGGAQRRSVAGEDSLTAIALYTQQSFLLCSLQNDDSMLCGQESTIQLHALLDLVWTSTRPS
jgi:hypothetical protein